MQQNVWTQDYKKITDCLSVCVSVTNSTLNFSKIYNAIWDTGATNSVITQKVFDELKLPNVDTVEVYGVNSISNAVTTVVNIKLPNNKEFIDCDVMVCNLIPDADILLGMDIITQGSFLVNNDGNTVLSFAMPPLNVSLGNGH